MTAMLDDIRSADFTPRYGRVLSLSPGLIEASGPQGVVGEICSVEAQDGPVLAEIVALDERRVLLTPFDSVATTGLGARVEALGADALVTVGDAFAGRAVDALGHPVDGGPAVRTASRAPLAGQIPPPLQRSAPIAVVQTGVRAIDALLTLGKGQRIGIVAASGVGKTSLVEQLAVQTSADHVVLCLVGERGREVQSLWHLLNKRADSKRFTLVAATSDESAAQRARAPSLALALAEYWRDAGRDVLFLVDSVTRLAMALRETGLAAGSPPTVRAYTPNVFSALPRLVERCGAIAGGGAITAIMTVLSETDDADDPIVEVMKSLLDGHIVLSRLIAEQGQFPAIDVVRSVSRGIEKRVEREHREAQIQVVAMLAAYEESRVMIEAGAYRAGTNPVLDRAIAGREAIQRFLKQGMDEDIEFDESARQILELAGAIA
jgi:flagellum-specific ATP synthase